MELAKGVRDYPPEMQLIREELFAQCKSAFETFGFAPFATPVIERRDTLTFKFEGDEDVMQELFLLSDQGGRDLGLRFDLTVPLCRYVASNKDLKFPFKRYEIGRVYRDGPIKAGRYREFWQCDADIVGAKSLLADAECIKVAADILEKTPFNFTIKVNNRKLLNDILKHCKITNTHKAIIAIDKLAKQGVQVVREELSELTSQKNIDTLFSIITTKKDLLSHIESAIGKSEGLDELKELFTYLEDLKNVEFDPTLARGLNYYTGTVFEGFIDHKKITGSVCAGGRYDNIIGQMMGSKQPVPAVGISIGVEPLTDALLSKKKDAAKTSTQIFVAPIKVAAKAASIADTLRKQGYRVDLDVMNRSISKNLDYADKLGIPFVIIIGPKDVEKNVFVLRNMSTGEETSVPLADLKKLDLDSY